MSDERFRTVLGRLDSGPRPGDDEVGRRLWERIEPVLLAEAQPEAVDDRPQRVVSIVEEGLIGGRLTHQRFAELT